MNIWERRRLSKLLSFIKPHTLETYKSQYNGDVRVLEQFGQRKIYAGGLLQSGSIIKQLWQKPLKSVGYRHACTLPINILILGFGGGTVADLLIKQFPRAQITGIEIDSVMIEIYRKYFVVVNFNSPYSNINLIQADCFHWINKCKQKYDLILVDLYQGHDIPEELYEIKFIKNLKKCQNPNGSTLINHLFFDKYKEKVPDLIKIVETEFSDIKLIRNLSNIFLLAI